MTGSSGRSIIKGCPFPGFLPLSSAFHQSFSFPLFSVDISYALWFSLLLCLLLFSICYLLVHINCAFFYVSFSSSPSISFLVCSSIPILFLLPSHNISPTCLQNFLPYSVSLVHHVSVLLQYYTSACPRSSDPSCLLPSLS